MPPVLKTAVRLLVATAALAAAAPAAAQEPPQRPERRESDALPPSSVRLPTILGGLGMTTGFWALGYGTAELSGGDVAYEKLRVPIVGPFQALKAQNCGDSGCGFTTYFSYAYFSFQALAQVGGLGVALTGMVIPTSNAAPGPRMPTPTGPSRPAPTGPTEDAPAPTAPKGPMFFLPGPMPMGRGGMGVGWGGIF